MVVSAARSWRIELVIDTIRATLVVVHTILQWCSKFALVRDIMFHGESVRRLWQCARDYFYDSVQWSKVFAAI